jgi:hypothetical protein
VDNTFRQTRSHLFTVRIWSEELGDGQKEWRGQMQYVPSGEPHYFRDWQSLVDFFKEELSRLEQDLTE